MCSLTKIKHLILLTTAAVAASSLSSCKEEPYMITAEEEYTRNFIKEFGLIDPKQDWNLAEGSTVTVKVGSTPAQVKAYMKVDNTYYLVANLKDVVGDVKIPFDMPEGTKDIMVKINGKRYYTTPGGTVDPNNAASRGLLNTGENTFDDVVVKVEENPHGRVLTLTETTMKEAIQFLPENPDGVSTWEKSNLGKVTDNFFATAKEFYIFPEYWYTSHNSDNIIGVYWYVNENTSGATQVTYRETPADAGTSKWIILLPFFQNPSDFLTAWKTGSENLNYKSFSALPKSEEIQEKLFEKYPDIYYMSEGEAYRKYSDGSTKLLKEIQIKQDWSDVNDELADDIISVDDSYFWITKKNDDGNIVKSEFSHVIPVHATGKTDWSGAIYPDAEYYESKGVHIVFNQEISFGFYIKQGDDVMYSEAALNPPVTKNGETRLPSYVATKKYGTDTEGNDKRHLCFEDWYGDNWDLNDMIFRVYGFDNIADGSMEIGNVTDINNPNGNEVDEPYHWLLAVEDLGGTDDFDFNDIIVGITAELVVEADLPSGARTVGDVISNATQGDVTGNCWNKVTFTALAAGGTLPTYIFYGEEQLYPDGKPGRAEWHKWFGDGTISSGKMINTGHGNDNQKGETCTIYFGADNNREFLFSVDKLGVRDKYSTDAKNSGFKVGIDKAGETSYASDYIDHDYFTKGEDGYFVKSSNPGEAPQMFLIPDRWNKNGDNTGTSTYDTGKWQWPTERTHIQDSYSRFGAWVNNASDASDWYKDTGKNVCRPTAK